MFRCRRVAGNSKVGAAVNGEGPRVQSLWGSGAVLSWEPFGKRYECVAHVYDGAEGTGSARGHEGVLRDMKMYCCSVHNLAESADLLFCQMAALLSAICCQPLSLHRRLISA